MNSTWHIITTEEVSCINNNPVWQCNYHTITCRSESVLLWFEQLESHEALQLKQNKTAMWKNIMPNRLSNPCFCKEISSLMVQCWEWKWRLLPQIHPSLLCSMCHKEQRGHSANKRKGIHFRHEPLPSLSPVCASLHLGVSCQALKIVAPATEIRIYFSTQAHTNNHKITCNPRYTAGMPIILDLSK